MSLRPSFSPVASLVACLVAGAFAPRAQAAGFQLREQSPSAQGLAFAGVSAGGEDISATFFNPAGMTRFKDSQVSIGTSYVAPVAEFSEGSASRAPVYPVLQRPISGPDSHPNSAKSVGLPVMAAMWSLGEDLRLGFSINAPFGMATVYKDDFIGRYHALRSDLKIVDFAPSIAYKLSDELSLGATFIARKATAEISNAVDFGAIQASAGIPGAIPGGQDGIAVLKGDKWGCGYRLGLTYQPMESLRLGLAHAAAMDMTLDGTITYQGVPAILASRFLNGGATAEMNLPAATSLGVEYQATDRLTLLGEVSRTDWSSFKELRVKFKTGQADSVTVEDWQNSYYWALGARLKWDDKNTLRAGLAFDQGAATDATRTPRIPDADRTWLSFGWGHSFSSRFSVDLAYTRIFVKEGPIGLASGTTAESPDFYRGNLSGVFNNHIDILAVQGRFTF
jgi:long-chain fatty acid transport protein